MGNKIKRKLNRIKKKLIKLKDKLKFKIVDIIDNAKTLFIVTIPFKVHDIFTKIAHVTKLDKLLNRRPLCNDDPDSIVYIKGFQLPLCSRCLGILTIALPYTIYLIFSGRIVHFYDILGQAIGILILIVDHILTKRGIWKPDNIRRFITGAFAGRGYAFAVLWIYQLFGFYK